MTTTPKEVSTNLMYQIAEAIRERHPNAFVETGVSNRSASCYLDVSFEDENGNLSSPVCIRISDHEARTYNRDGDFRIGLGHDGDNHVSIGFTAVYERDEFTAISWDENGEAIDFESERMACGEDDDDAELEGYEAENGDIETAFIAAMDFIARKAAQ